MTIPGTASVTSFRATLRRGHRGLYLFAVVMAALTAVFLVAAVVDQRTLMGQPLWFKPLKFSISLGLYAAALCWLMARLRRVSRTVVVAGWVIAVTSGIEMIWIAVQAARGQRSHFNDTSASGALAYNVMGGVVGVLFLAAVVVAFVVVRQDGPDRVVTSAVRSGLLVALAGMAVGIIMVVHGGHAVGVADGGPGMLGTGWSTTGGDLRIGHFLGLHALQLLPLAAAAVTVLGVRRGWTEATQLRLVRVLALGYLGTVVLVVWQALRAEPLTRPGPVTLAAAFALVVTIAATGRAALRGGRAPAVAVSGAGR